MNKHLPDSYQTATNPHLNADSNPHQSRLENTRLHMKWICIWMLIWIISSARYTWHVAYSMDRS